MKSHQLKTRLQALPMVFYSIIRRHVIDKSAISESTWTRVMKGAEPPARMIVALEEILGCTGAELLNPDHYFDAAKVLYNMDQHVENQEDRFLLEHHPTVS